MEKNRSNTQKNSKNILKFKGFGKIFKPKKKDKKDKLNVKSEEFRMQQSSSPPATNTSPPELEDFQMVQDQDSSDQEDIQAKIR